MDLASPLEKSVKNCGSAVLNWDNVIKLDAVGLCCDQIVLFVKNIKVHFQTVVEPVNNVYIFLTRIISQHMNCFIYVFLWKDDQKSQRRCDVSL